MTEKMTVIITANTSWNLWNFRKCIIDALLERDVSVIAVAPRDSFSEKLEEIGCEYIELRMSQRGRSPLQEVKTILQLRKIYKQKAPDFVLGFTIKNNLYSGLALGRNRRRLLPNVSGLGSGFQSGLILSSFVKMLYRFTFKGVPAVLFQNPEDSKEFVKSGIIQQQQSVVLPGSGVNLDKFTPSQNSGKPAARTFLMSCRLLWKKGVGDFVEAAHIVSKRFPGAKFKLVGFPVEDPKLGATIDQVKEWEAERVIQYCSHLDDVRPALRDADVFVLPSTYAEGTPRSLLEALAMGMPVITTNRPGCRRTIDNGKNGFLCEPGDAQNLAEQIIKLNEMNESDFAAFRSYSREKSEKEFDEKRVVATYLELTLLRDAESGTKTHSMAGSPEHTAMGQHG